MGKVSVIGQRENVQTESPSFPGLPGLTGDAANIEGNGPTGALEGLCKLQNVYNRILHSYLSKPGGTEVCKDMKI